jgi:hypothetical protein
MFLQISAGEATQILTIEKISVLGLLLAVILYLIWKNISLEKEIKTKDDKIDTIIKEHRQDIKDSTKDAVQMVNRYHIFVEQLSSLTRGKHR